MSASDHLSPDQFGGPFYHGSIDRLGVGDMLTSSASRGQVSEYEGANPGASDFVHATPLLRDAQTYAGLKATHHRAATGVSPAMYVYQVEPTGPVHEDPNDFDAVRSAHPMRVTGML